MLSCYRYVRARSRDRSGRARSYQLNRREEESLLELAEISGRVYDEVALQLLRRYDGEDHTAIR